MSKFEKVMATIMAWVCTIKGIAILLGYAEFNGVVALCGISVVLHILVRNKL